MGKGDLVPRIVTSFGVQIQQANEEAFRRAWPVNLSETGICIRLGQSIPIGQPVQLRIRLGEKAESMELAGKTVWLRKDDINDVLYCGVGFDSLSDSQLEQIRAYVELGGSALLRFFSEFPLFKDFSQTDCRSLLRIVTLRNLDRKEVLYQEDTRDIDLHGLFIVQSGLLSIFKGRNHRPDRQLAVVSSGQVFGETTLVTDQSHSATVMAVNDSTLIQINKLGFRLLAKDNPHLALKIMDVVAKTLVSRLGRTTKQLFAPIRF